VFAGYRSPIIGSLAGADLVVNPSTTEGLPNVILEAYSVAVPVVATNVGGVSELVIPDRTGWLVPAKQPSALADAIVDALSDSSRAQAMGKAGQRFVADHFSFHQQAVRLSNLCDSALGRGGSRSVSSGATLAAERSL
jgi:glycosyltransferase involved in cell wall biosynthesis